MKLLLYFLCSLYIPIAALIIMNGEVIDNVASLNSTAGLALLLFSIVSLIKKLSPRLSWIVGGILLLSMLWIRFLLGFLYDFSGRGFSSDFFAHINRTSFEVSWGTYPKELTLLLILLCILAFAAIWLIRSQQSKPLKIILLSAASGLVLIYAGATGSPELLLAQAYARYTQTDAVDSANTPSTIADRALAKDILTPIRENRPLPVDKHEIQATLPDKPLNLILVYLESFNDVLSNEKLYPELTPRINILKHRYQSFSQIYGSAFVTIEGIANSQCGTLFNMERANNSLTTKQGRLSNLPCLGDILKVAGYQQTYLGGAGMAFAGKGAFLSAHGYDEILGRAHWETLGFERHKDWGIADNILFDQAFETIVLKHQRTTPFNVTLLTLGTHIPGFTYEGCPAYTEDKSKVFLNAVHCTDYLLGQFVENLEEAGVLDDTVLFIQADHGVFPNKTMKTLFGDHVYDSRLLTIIATPDPVDKDQLNATKHSEGSSLNSVATILTSLKVSHNADFVLAQTHTKQPKNPYFVSRYNDHAKQKAVINNAHECTDSPQEVVKISLPLGDCDKSRTMRAINLLNLSYAKTEQANNNGICKLGAKVTRDKDSGRIKFTWGNQNLSEQFYWRGLKKHKDQITGVYAVLLDHNDSILQTLFYDSTDYQDVVWLNELLNNSVETTRLFLYHNVDRKNLSLTIQNIWPEILGKHSIVYADIVDRQLVPLKLDEAITPDASFLPLSCVESVTEKAQ